MKDKISIIIPTYKRQKYLLDMLDSLKGKIRKSMEVIVVEQVENNKNSYLEKAKVIGIDLKYFFIDKASTPHAKNLGVSKAKGDFIIFFDDDVLLKTKLDFYIEDFKNKKIAAVTGRSIARNQPVESWRLDTGKITLMGNFTDGYSSNNRQEIDTVIGCNAAWNKEVFLLLKGFDENFTGNALREESDLSLRARKIGYKIVFDPRVEIEHVRAESGGARKTEGRIQWYFDFFSNETYFFLKHRPMWVVPVIILTRWEWAFRCMFGFGREVSFRSLSTPFKGFMDGYRKYILYKNENRS